MRKLPPLNALRIFETTARFDSFTSAAKVLCITPGAVSHQIKSLEEWLGQPLFIRNRDGIQLTETGRGLQNISSEVFSTLEISIQAMCSNDHAQQVRIGCSGSFLGYWLIPILERFERDWPSIKLDLCVSDGIEDLLVHKIDVLIVIGRKPPALNINAQMLVHDVIGPVCAPSYSHSLQDNLLHTSSRPSAWTEWADRAGVTIEIGIGRTFDSLSHTLEAARSGLGYAIAPELLIRRDLERGTLVAPMGFVKTEGSIYLCTLSSQEHADSVEKLKNWLTIQPG
ncbi:MAG: LysR substrate-binding domain-containing protein [Halothiobacillus sp.]|nr:LysR substrate-binding domain-containing protein [Halothiobacillus sp.]